MCLNNVDTPWSIYRDFTVLNLIEKVKLCISELLLVKLLLIILKTLVPFDNYFLIVETLILKMSKSNLRLIEEIIYP